MPCFFALVLVLLLAACQPAGTPTPLPLAVRIMGFWEPVADTISEAAHPWQFVGWAGDAIRLRALGEVSLTLQDKAGVTLATGNPIEITLPVDDIYIVYVSGNGPYELGLSYTDRPNPAEITATPIPQVVGVPTPTPPFYASLGTVMGALVSGEARTGAFAEDDEQHVYTFDGQAGQYLNVRIARVSGATDPLVQLYAPAGSALAMDDNSGGEGTAQLRNLRLPQTGIYSFQVGRGRGAYEIRLTASDSPFSITPTVMVQPTETPIVEILTPTLAFAPNDSRLTEHVPVIGQATRPGDVIRYVLALTAGEPVTIGVWPAPDSPMIPRLEIYNPGGELVVAASGLNSNRRDVFIPLFTPAETGAFLAYITAEGSTSGDYIFAYGRGASFEEVRRGRAEPDVPYTSTLQGRGQREAWSLFLRTDDEISAAVRSLDFALNVVLELVAPDGSLLAQANTSSGQDALITAVRAPVTGLYQLRVAGTEPVSGSYTLVWRYINLAPTPTPLPNLLPVLAVDDFLPSETYLFYPFQGQAGQSVEITVTAQAGSPLDAVAALIAPDGSVIAEADDTDGLNPRLVVALPMDGTYTVRVSSYLSSGSFTLTVNALV